ncbi:nuclear transport factor 2 family protein [Zhouia sp. PK063]|uniref:nuclear transport factor 2 family protein n=1 Tax=Zhouia sp. PK063 TaxID=3373602 RepID=UPI0037BD6CFA
MKNKILLLLLFTIFFSTIKTSAQETSSEKNLNETLEVFKMALINPTKSTLDVLTSDDLDYWHSTGKHETKNQFMLSLLSGKSDFVTLEFSDQKISVHKNFAIVHQTLEGDTKDDGIKGHVKIGNILVWEKNGEQWKLVARQAYKLPEETTPAKDEEVKQ